MPSHNYMTPQPPANAFVPTTGRPNVVRFGRLNGFGEETIDLDQCIRLLVCPRGHANAGHVDPSTITVYYLTPNHRAIMGLGGWDQIQRGGAGYLEVHPIQIAREMHLFGWRLPPELAQYLPVIELGLTLFDSISAWEKLQSGVPEKDCPQSPEAHVPFLRGDEQHAAVRASGPEKPEAPIPNARPKVPRGRLDETATIELKKNPALTFKQLAAALGCKEGTLRDKKKCPLLAAAKAMIQAERDKFRDGSNWQDRRPDDDDV